MTVTTRSASLEAHATGSREQAVSLDEESKRLLAAILGFVAVVRHEGPPAPDRDAGLGLRRAMRQYGLTSRHASALLAIALWGPMTVTELAERHRVGLKTASLVAIDLEQAGLIERRQDATDRRRTILVVARRKERLIAEGLTRRAAPLQRTLLQLSKVHQQGLITGLETLVREMSGTAR